jgi:uncharacterized protein YqjF (DUF2071 family)
MTTKRVMVAAQQSETEVGANGELAPHPVPEGPWLMQQRWHDLLFAHWPYPVDSVRALIPRSLEVDTFDDKAWVGVTPFFMTGVRMRLAPPVPTAYSFAELNVRTYVIRDGVPGVWFFSLDAASTLAVIGARMGARLPYFRANMTVDRDARAITYRSQRWPPSAVPAEFEARYAPRPHPLRVKPRSLEYFLTERYSLYTSDRDSLWRGDIHHPRWKLHEAQADIRTNTMIEAAGLEPPHGSPLLHFSTCQDVRLWWPQRVA